MVEVVFSESVAGHMAYAMGRNLPFGSRNDIFSFPLSLSIGEIDENGISKKREEILFNLFRISLQTAEKTAAKYVKESKEKLIALTERAANGEPVRIWNSDMPEDACGTYWLMNQLYPIGLKKTEVIIVKLPKYEEREDGVSVRYEGWGEVESARWGKMATLGKKLPVNLMSPMAEYWRQLCQENMPLRAVVNGRLVSVPETFYDTFILREIASQEQEFSEAEAIVNILVKYRLGIGDSWIALRIEEFIRSGLLSVGSFAKDGEAVYRQILRKK